MEIGGEDRPLIDNTQLLRHLMVNKLIRLHDSQILNRVPNSLPASCKYERIEGMLLGIAIGDALGLPLRDSNRSTGIGFMAR